MQDEQKKFQEKLSELLSYARDHENKVTMKEVRDFFEDFALDEQGVAMIAQLIRKECQRSALVVVACHDADFVQSVSDVVIQMQAGRVTSVIGK